MTKTAAREARKPQSKAEVGAPQGETRRSRSIQWKPDPQVRCSQEPSDEDEYS